ncbi:MAG: hypothetical protein H0W96_09935 [Solirubrobacterales bacterium]|nr:hypothetical protein [Solirubrobacterales bacterium]
MPTPEFEWQAYEIPADAADALSTFELAAPAEAPATIHLPVLTAFPTPLDKARILLESAAEVEHSLLVQYLYAGFSLKQPDELSDSAQKRAVDFWMGTLRGIARQEMGHLMTAQNLLLSIGMPPNLEREDFPPRKDLYPFKMHLEPLSQRSLAKYVAGESPAGASGIDDILALANESAGAPVNHVGVLYGLLAVVFSTKEEIERGGSGSESWDRMLRELAAAAHQQAPPEAWHLTDAAIDPATEARQGDHGWERGNKVFLIPDRASALVAIRDIAEEGEGSVEGAESHFSRLLAMFRGADEIMPFPAPGAFVPAHPLPTDPRADHIAEPRTKRWAQLADAYYAILLGAIEQHLRISDDDDRRMLRNWAITDMHTLQALSRRLTKLPNGAGVAALPFTLPTRLSLPGDEAARWQVLLARLTASIEAIEELQRYPADEADETLASLLKDMRQRRDVLTQGHAPATTSFATDIRPLFRPMDIAHMNNMVGVDLTAHDIVSQLGAAISGRLKLPGNDRRRMPPPPDDPWPPERIALFDKWVAEGSPP